MSFLELVKSKFKISKPIKVVESVKKQNYVDPNIVYLFRIEVPSKHYQVDIYEHTQTEALFETLRIMALTEIPDDVIITKSEVPESSYFKHQYLFRNTASYIKPIKYKLDRYDEASLVVNE